MDGSMLFYATLSLLVGWWGSRKLALGRVGVGVVAVVGAGYLLITALVANPFYTLDIPAVDGSGLLAILQHPAMVYHPPILYLGLTALIVPAALTAEAVFSNGVDRSWTKHTHRWLLISWTLLTLGMVAGANWAYAELGWGGFWAWDPVENTSLMPWLAATIFFHWSRIQVQSGRLRRSNVFVTLLAFSLTVLGVYLTRSGVTGSIHAFAEDPVIGRVLLTAALVALGGSVVVATRAPRGEPWERFGFARDTWLLVSGMATAAVLVFVVVGSAYPAYAGVFAQKSLSIGSRFFTTTVYPFALLIVAGLPFAFRTRWKQPGVPLRSALILFIAAGAVGLATSLVATNPTAASTVLFAHAVAAVGLLGLDMFMRRPKKRRLGGYLAHLGLAMVVVGAAASAMGDEFNGVLAPGDSVEVGGHTITMLSVDTGEADRFIFAEARMDVDGEDTLTPQIRAYEDQALPVAEPAIRSRPSGDVIVAISLLFPDANAADVSVFVRPMVWWVWAGSLVIALAGLVLLAGRAGGGAVQRREARARRPPEGTTTGTFAR
jgi:cytochrome c-type biogenesis protein CcmF